MLKVLLIVVQGKPEGKSIPITGPVFRIGRGEDCHLRPNSEEVSRRHTELTISDTEVTVRDLGSRNGTRVNGKPLKGTHTLKSGELLQVGPLTFAVTIIGAPDVAAAAPSQPSQPGQPGRASAVASLDDVPTDQISAWLVSDNARPTPDRPSGVYDGDTLTIEAYKESVGGKPKSSPSVAKPPEVEPERPSAIETALENLEIEPLPEGEGDAPAEAEAPAAEAGEGEGEGEAEGDEGMPQEMIDENNPFFAKKPGGGGAEAAAAAKPQFKDSSDAASDILRRMLERRRAGRP
jgi:pSer/pThr/pTyr-binding forkhead associated (FHA) protein